MDWLYYSLLLLLALTGLVVNLFQLPGLWLMVLGGLAYAYLTGWQHLGWPGLLIVTALAIIAEVVEFLAGAAGAKRYGSTRVGMLGAILGSLIGAIAASPILPIIGTILGAVAGAFVGAAVAEWVRGRPTQKALWAGVGAAKGRFIGILVKSAIGIAMLLALAIAAIPL